MRFINIKKWVIVVIAAMLPSYVLAFDAAAPYAILMDYDTGQVLYEKGADDPLNPSSMSKMMTTYVVFDYLKNNKLSKDQQFFASANIANIEGSKMFIAPGDKATVEELLYGAIVQSGNDACMVLAENISGSEEGFVKEMNAHAKKLNLNNTQYDNCMGFSSPNHMTTARDLAKLAQRLITDFPEYYHYNAVKEWSFNNITQQNRNRSLGFYGIDGIKTGHTEAGGYGITVSALHDNRRIIAVINGLPSEKARKKDIESLVEYAFKGFDKYQFAKALAPLGTVLVWYGAQETVSIGTEKDLSAFLEKGTDSGKLRAALYYDSPVLAPLVEGQELGIIKIYNDDILLVEGKVIALKDVGKSGFFRKIWYNVRYILGIYN